MAECKACKQRKSKKSKKGRGVKSISEDITADMRLSQLGKLWLIECEQSERTPQTVAQYRAIVEKIIEPGLGGLQIRGKPRFPRSTDSSSLWQPRRRPRRSRPR